MKGMAVPGAYAMHRIILPLYIPAGDGYYSDAFEIFQICFQTLRTTVSAKKASVTVIDNGCASWVRNWLYGQVNSGSIDQLIINKANRGKPDAIFGAARASYEPFVTFADADVFFYPGWLEAVEGIFLHFPEAGVASPFPGNHVRHLHTVATWLHHLHELRFKSVVPREDMIQFGASTGNPERYAEVDLHGQWCIQRGGVVAVLGAVHFVVTCRRAVVDAIEKTPSLLGLGQGPGVGMRKLDVVCDRLGFSKLSAPVARVRHMGNRLEPWMHEELEKVLSSASQTREVHRDRLLPEGRPGYARFIPQRLHPFLSKVIAVVERKAAAYFVKRLKAEK